MHAFVGRSIVRIPAGQANSRLIPDISNQVAMQSSDLHLCVPSLVMVALNLLGWKCLGGCAGGRLMGQVVRAMVHWAGVSLPVSLTSYSVVRPLSLPSYRGNSLFCMDSLA